MDRDCVIGAGATVGEYRGEPPDTAESVTLIGRGCRVPDSATIDAGGRLEPGTTG